MRFVVDETMAGSAAAAPAAGFGDFERYSDVALKAAVLLHAVASNHALPDGNKRTALLCAILFAAASRSIPLPALAAGSMIHSSASRQ